MIRELRYWTEYSAETADGNRCVTMKFPEDGTAMGTEVTDVRDGGLTILMFYVDKWFPANGLTDEDMFEIADYLADYSQRYDCCQAVWGSFPDGEKAPPVMSWLG